MKHTIAFVFWLAAIFSLGFFSTDIAARFLHEQETAVMEPRAQDTETPILLDADPDIGFDPMGIVRNRETAEAGPGKHGYAVMAASMMRVISQSYNEWTMSAETEEKLISAVKMTDNGYAFAERFAYTSGRGNVQFLDFIVSTPAMRIVYMRFYSENSQETDTSSISLAEKRLRDSSENFYRAERIDSWTNAVYDALYSDSWDYYRDYLIEDPEDIAFVDEMFGDVFNAGSRAAVLIGSDELNCFWGRLIGLSWVNFSYDESYRTVDAVNYIFDAVRTDGMGDSSYTFYKGRIYQSIYFGPNRLIVIYNVADGRPEGFFAKPSV